MYGLFLTIMFFVLSSFLPLDGALPFRLSPKELTEITESIYQLPEGRRLIDQANERGPIALELQCSKTFQFKGLWNASKRTITINCCHPSRKAQMIQTLLIELWNAAESEFLETTWRMAQQGKIDKENFVKGLERWEHDHVKASSKIIEAGIKQHLFPEEARLTAYRDFHCHYLIQQMSGHSQWYAAEYDHCSPSKQHTPYLGSLPNAEQLTEDEKTILLRYINWREQIAAGIGCRSTLLNKVDIEQLRLETVIQKGYEEAKRQLALFNSVFKEMPMELFADVN